ncbi:hypothetical protein Leryth_020096 [Lithospermum erythrorhizon]|nr:hypothetical protein Leryth_020096 [Lithospermum erythrorhizon]
MAKSTSFLLICFITLLLLPSPQPTNATSLDHQLTLFDFPAAEMTSSSGGSGSCSGGSIGECFGEDMGQLLDGDGEFEMESETTRRMLAYRRRYISYGALSRNRVPCSRRGASYYNCRPGAAANPYRRGCSAITRCRR